jgi:hypothetical protein
MKSSHSRLAAMCATLLLAAGCTYVKDTDEGRGVRVVRAADVQQCTSLGKVRVSVVKMLRGEKFVREDLMTLARNHAAKSGADTIVAVGEPVNSEQEFEMYRCIRP